MWKNVTAAPADAILGLTEAFKNDTRANKINLGVGIYQDESGATPVLKSVKAAEERLFHAEQTKSYLPIAGDAAYGDAVQTLILGGVSDRATTIHTPGGTGALRVAGELLKKFSSKTIWVSDPTWANHKNIFNACDLTIEDYPYYDAEHKSLAEDAFFAALENVPAGDAVLLHACCHNPTGVDLTAEHWARVSALSAKNGWTAVIDFAYQGFGKSVEADRMGVEAFYKAGVAFFVASSFSKNFGLYRERTGALTAIANCAENTATAASHLKATARVLYSNPPAHGGLIVTTLLQDPELAACWKSELDGMRKRIATMRSELATGLMNRNVSMDCSFITNQRGMFSFSGLTKKEVTFLRDQHAIFIVGSGRINVAGLTPTNIKGVCDAVAEAMNN